MDLSVLSVEEQMSGPSASTFPPTTVLIEHSFPGALDLALGSFSTLKELLVPNNQQLIIQGGLTMRTIVLHNCKFSSMQHPYKIALSPPSSDPIKAWKTGN